MPARKSEALTQSLLKEREGKAPRSILSQMALLIEPERSQHLSPHIWVFWGKPYQDIFDGIGHCLQHLSEKGWDGSTRPKRVYEGHLHTMRDFLDLPDDGSIAFVHEAHRLRGTARTRQGEGFEAYFKVFQRLFQSKYLRNQLVFLSPEPFLRQLPEMENVKIVKGKVDVGWFWPPDEGQPSATVSYDAANPIDVNKAFELEWSKRESQKKK